ncbi:maleylpyruvate isomerase family mycothiol-dependent enzyme [Actinomycetospora sp. OC33-EN08]|uniref:Maleylpyruvate isomerase family mycothiol-dependent enzyme n=1 Tax=Actinomycetospora aurantiaca TaxID=3129233 RepID=A0ABU8MMG6_9PSEU
MDADDWISAVAADGRELGRLCRERPDTTVRSCPDWTGADLLAHAAGFCRTLDELFAGRREARDPAVVVPPDEALRTYGDDLAALLRLLTATDPGAPVKNWSVLPDDAAYWFRRAAHEFAIHRWDAATTADGEPEPVPPDLARDGIAEFFESFVATAFAYGFMPPKEATLVVELTDLDETLTQDLPRPGPTTTMRGSAPEIVLAFWHRRDPVAFHAGGDRAILEAWPHI